MIQLIKSSDRIKYLRTELLGITQAELAELLGRNEQYVKDLERGKIHISPRLAIILSNIIVRTKEGIVKIVLPGIPLHDLETPISREWLVYGRGPMFRCQNYRFFSETDNQEVYLSQDNCLRFFTMQDNSMSPEITKGHFFAIDSSKKDIKDGYIYYILYGEEKLLRQIETLKYKKLLLKPLNEEHEKSITVSADKIEILGELYFTVGVFPRV